jgi:dimethylargininase
VQIGNCRLHIANSRLEPVNHSTQIAICNLQSSIYNPVVLRSPVAITRAVSPALGSCELTHQDRVPIDVARAVSQHHLYRGALTDAGYRVEQLESTGDMPDSVFVEDIAVVFNELAVVTRPGAASRRAEVAAVAEALAVYRPLSFIKQPGTIDGGDVLVVGKRVFIGGSTRTNADAVAQMRRLLGPLGYVVCEVAIDGCLHLKSAVTTIDEQTLLLNPAWIAPAAFRDFEIVTVDDREPHAANALRLRDRIVMASAYPRTADRVAARGLQVVTVDASELAKAEGALTCCSLIIEPPSAQRVTSREQRATSDE